VLIRHYCIRNYQEGPAALARECRPLPERDSAVTGYRFIDEKFETLESYGPHNVRQFVEETAALGATLGFFWTLAAELPAQMAGAYIGEHYWHHGRPVVFFRATQIRTWLECKAINNYSCRRLSSSDMHKVKLFLVASLSETENTEAKEAQEAFVREFPAADIQKVFPPKHQSEF